MHVNYDGAQDSVHTGRDPAAFDTAVMRDGRDPAAFDTTVMMDDSLMDTEAD